MHICELTNTKFLMFAFKLRLPFMELFSLSPLQQATHTIDAYASSQAKKKNKNLVCPQTCDRTTF